MSGSNTHSLTLRWMEVSDPVSAWTRSKHCLIVLPAPSMFPSSLWSKLGRHTCRPESIVFRLTCTSLDLEGPGSGPENPKLDYSDSQFPQIIGQPRSSWAPTCGCGRENQITVVGLLCMWLKASHLKGRICIFVLIELIFRVLVVSQENWAESTEFRIHTSLPLTQFPLLILSCLDVVHLLPPSIQAWYVSGNWRLEFALGLTLWCCTAYGL